MQRHRHDDSAVIIDHSIDTLDFHFHRSLGCNDDHIRPFNNLNAIPSNPRCQRLPVTISYNRR